jgi:hypothetical protein
MLYVRSKHKETRIDVLFECVRTLDGLCMFDRDLTPACEVELSDDGARLVVHEYFGDSATILDRLQTIRQMHKKSVGY